MHVLYECLADVYVMPQIHIMVTFKQQEQSTRLDGIELAYWPGIS